MYIANIHFGKYRIGDEVPMNLPNHDERLKRGLIREIKVVAPIELKTETYQVKEAAKNVARKSKVDTKQAK